MKAAFVLLGLLLLGVGCYGGRSYTQERTPVLEGNKAVVVFRIQATCAEGDIRDATIHWLHGRTPYLSNLNLVLTVGDFESGGKPVVVFPESPDDSSRDQGWYYVVVPPGPTYLGLAPGVFHMLNTDLHGEGTHPCVERRVDVPMSTKIVYAGTWWTQCTVGLVPDADVILVQSVELAERGITNDIDEACAVARRCFPELGDPVFVGPQEITGPRVIRTPPGQRAR